MTKDMIFAKIKLLIKNRLKMTTEPNVNFNLFNEGNHFDSLTLLEFILELEDEFSIIIADEDLVPENFESIKKIGNYIFELYKADGQVIQQMDMMWNVTGQCNYRCPMCWDPFKQINDFNTKEMLNIADEIAEKKPDAVILTGGEPLLRDDLFEIADRLYQNGVHCIKLCSNGAMLNERWTAFKNSNISEIHIFMHYRLLMYCLVK